MTVEKLLTFGMSIVMLGLTISGPALWLVLLNRRDRRQAAMLNTVLDQVGSRDLRGRVAVQVRYGLLSHRSAVAVDVLAISRNEVWEILMRLARHVSRHVRLEVTAVAEREFLVTFTLDTAAPKRLPATSEPALATG